MRTAIYTCITGAFTPLTPHVEIPGVDWVAFMDAPEERDDWEVVPLFCPANQSPRLSAKGPKLSPDAFLDHDVTIWIDGAYEVTDPNFVTEATAFLNDSDMAMWRHPDRDCIYAEAQASLRLPKYQGDALDAQVEHYRREGHPVHWGLWASGAIARRQTDQQRRLSEAWMAEVSRWSVQDQLSFPWCLRQLDMSTPGEFPGPPAFYGGPWLRHAGFQTER